MIWKRYGDPAKLAAMRAIKAALDPAGIMNPGAVLRDPDPAARGLPRRAEIGGGLGVWGWVVVAIFIRVCNPG